MYHKEGLAKEEWPGEIMVLKNIMYSITSSRQQCNQRCHSMRWGPMILYNKSYSLIRMSLAVILNLMHNQTGLNFVITAISKSPVSFWSSLSIRNKDLFCLYESCRVVNHNQSCIGIRLKIISKSSKHRLVLVLHQSRIWAMILQSGPISSHVLHSIYSQWWAILNLCDHLETSAFLR